MTPKVSICIPVFNGADFLRQCLDSCVQQSYRNTEIVIVDDCSTDATLQIAKEYSRRVNFVRVFQNRSNLGLAANWNRSVEVAVGEWVKFLFQDDLLEEDCIEKFVSYANDGVNLIVSQRSYFFSGEVDRRLERYYRKGVRTFESLRVRTNDPQINGPVISRLAVRNMGLNFIAEPSLVMVRRSVFSELGAFNTDLAQICDLEFMLRVASKHGLTLIPERLCHFRVHPQSVSLSHVEGRPYLLRHLDPIVLAWSFLVADQFAELRKALDSVQLVRLKKYFDVRCYEAALVAAESPLAAVAFDGIAQKYPEIGKAREASPATRILFGLVRARRVFRHIYVSCRYLWP